MILLWNKLWKKLCFRAFVKFMTTGIMRHIQKVMVLGAPLLAGLISEFFIYLSDSAMVGRLGTEYLAAMAIAVMVAEILWIIIWPLAPATQTIASQKYGRATAIDKKTAVSGMLLPPRGSRLPSGFSCSC